VKKSFSVLQESISAVITLLMTPVAVYFYVRSRKGKPVANWFPANDPVIDARLLLLRAIAAEDAANGDISLARILDGKPQSSFAFNGLSFFKGKPNGWGFGRSNGWGLGRSISARNGTMGALLMGLIGTALYAPAAIAVKVVQVTSSLIGLITNSDDRPEPSVNKPTIIQGDLAKEQVYSATRTNRTAHRYADGGPQALNDMLLLGENFASYLNAPKYSFFPELKNTEAQPTLPFYWLELGEAKPVVNGARWGASSAKVELNMLTYRQLFTMIAIPNALLHLKTAFPNNGTIRYYDDLHSVYSVRNAQVQLLTHIPDSFSGADNLELVTPKVEHQKQKTNNVPIQRIEDPATPLQQRGAQTVINQNNTVHVDVSLVANEPLRTVDSSEKTLTE
jgi:hypothetical protein